MDLRVFLSLVAGCLLSVDRVRGCTNLTGFCERIDFDLYRDTWENRALKGHSFLSITVKDAPECQMKCISDCRCLSTNYREDNNGGHGYCELNNADQVLNPKALVESPGSYFYKIKRKFFCKKAATVFDPRIHACPKSCCRSSTCPAHTTCKEICLPKFKRFICECSSGSTDGCERVPRSCQDIMKSLGFSPSDGLYFVYDSQDKLYQVQCDFSSEPGFAFTLIESFSFANKQIFKPLGFYRDYPIEEDFFNWNKYRLSQKRMKIIAQHSTHLRTTCNRPSAFSYMDYSRVKLQELKLFEAFTKKCPRYERINMIGNQCFNCTVGTWQAPNEHLHVNAYYSISLAGCEFGGPGSGFSTDAHFFGLYVSTNRLFKCCSSAESTTQFWIGGK